jgi:hypothetical protein
MIHFPFVNGSVKNLYYRRMINLNEKAKKVNRLAELVLLLRNFIGELLL